MKEVIGFITWQWRQCLLYQKLFVAGAFVFGVAVMLPEPYDIYIIVALMFVTLAWMFKWCVWDNLKLSWIKYKEERNRLFDLIKDSEKAKHGRSEH